MLSIQGPGLLPGSPLRQLLEGQIRQDASRFLRTQGRCPVLRVILVGSDPASLIYTRRKITLSKALGFTSQVDQFSAQEDPERIYNHVRELNENPAIDGILVQRPLPESYALGTMASAVDPLKDVDGFHPLNVGALALNLPGLRPCTPLGVLALLDYYQIPLRGALVCVIGRSAIVGRPLAQMLTHRDATVIIAHRQTRHLDEISRQADIVVAALGQAQAINHNHIKSGGVVIDVGIHRNAQDRIVGDVDTASVLEQHARVTPVPGGIGPLTLCFLLLNTLQAAFGRMNESGKAYRPLPTL